MTESERQKNMNAGIRKFRILNRISRKGGIVFFGSDYFASLDFGELASAGGIGEPVYNRSFESLTVADASGILSPCVCDLRPGRVFLNFGESDGVLTEADAAAFTERYKRMILRLRRNCKDCRIFIVSVAGGRVFSGLNARLQTMAEETDCGFVDISASAPETGRDSALRMFNIVKPYMRSFPVGFADAMNYAAV